MKKLIALLLATLMVLAFAGCGSDNGNNSGNSAGRTFIMGIDAEYPPFSYMNDAGDYAGFDVEICKAACELLGWKFEVFAVNWDQKLIQLDANECDCVWSGMTILDSMKEAGYVISTPYFDNTQVLLVKSDSGINSSSDLAGKAVAVQLGTSGEALLNGDLAELKDTFGELVTCDSFLKCFTELEGNAVDAVLVDYPVAKSYADSKGDSLKIINEELGAEQYGIAFRKGDNDTCKAIEEAVQKLVESGKYAEIASKDEYKEIVNNLIFLNNK
ncbi:MAG: transporter substrate-binding domain-containing protein [Clostridia bacterium]|nr:transporter substrate-binding domain-containing protein [Clostridia bacterium]